MNAAILIAIEKYADANILERKYAEADARAFATVLEQHGFDPAQREILTNSLATKTAIESAVRTTLKRLTQDDSLCLYYGGHGFSQGGENHFTCHDTRRSDLMPTSLNLRWLCQHFQGSKCRQIVVFLDACTGNLLEGDEHRGLYADLNEAELQELFGGTANSLCFAACKSDERSYVSSDWKHGVWAYHLIQAFDGREPTALRGDRLTCSSLQEYLQLAVPATLRKTNPQAIQTPSRYGESGSDFQLADFADVLARRMAEKSPNAGQVKDSILLATWTDSVASLSGFQKSKGHFIPDRHGGSAQTYIREIARDDLQQDVERVRSALKHEFGFTRRQLTVEIQEGVATITTPKFNYSLSVEQDPNHAGRAAWRRAVAEITDPEQILSTPFEAVFGRMFDTVELSLHGSVDIDELIDGIEALGRDEIRVAYDEDEDVTSCVVRIAGHQAEIKVTRNTFSVVHPQVETPKTLLASLFNLQHALTDTHRVLTIPVASASAGDHGGVP